MKKRKIKYSNEGTTEHPICSTSHKHYTLDELLCGARPANLKFLYEKTEWAQEGTAIGRELT